MGANIFKWGQIYLFGSKYTNLGTNEKIQIQGQILITLGANFTANGSKYIYLGANIFKWG